MFNIKPNTFLSFNIEHASVASGNVHRQLLLIIFLSVSGNIESRCLEKTEVNHYLTLWKVMALIAVGLRCGHVAYSILLKKYGISILRF